MARVLLVDDDEDSRQVLEAILRYEGHEVVLAANGRQALFVLQQATPEPGASLPDIVFSDIQMPGMSGTEFCRTIRKDPALRDTYVILATGYDTPESRTEGIASGADDYVGKPVRADELHARIRLAMRVRGLHRDVAELKRRLAEGERTARELEGFAARTTKLRGDLSEKLGSLLDASRRGLEEVRRGEAKPALETMERLAGAIEALRASVAPRESPNPET